VAHGEGVSWFTVRIALPAEESRGAVVRALVAAGATAVVEREDELVTHLTDETDFATLECAVHAAGGGAVDRTLLADADWNAEWKARVGVQRLGRVAVAPPWLAATIADAECPVVIEPAMAFGTGEHETTRGVLTLMQDVLRPGDTVADLGAGSAVLAIAAAKLGARRAIAIEVDGEAIGNAEENVLRNGVTEHVTLIRGEAGVLLPLIGPVTVILANISASVLLELASPMRRALAPGGRAILSGVLVAERDTLAAGLAATGWTVERGLEEGEWWSCVVAPR
jgi:ribosomal protein L11 methyltransferase